MEQVNLDVWTLLVSDASSTVLEKLLQCIDFNNPPDFYDFSRSQRDLALRGGDTSGWIMLLDSQIALRAICRPAVLSEEQAWDLVQSALVFDPLFGGKLVRHLLEGRLWPGEVPLEEIMRVLSILENIPDIGRITMTLLKFIRYPNNRVHSKVAKILGHHLDNTPVLLELLRHPDARVRANLVEGIGYRKSTAGCAQYLDEAAKDQNHRVSSMALAIKARDGHAVSLALIQMRNRSKARIVSKTAHMATRLFLKDEAANLGLAVMADGLGTRGLSELNAAVLASVEEVHNQANRQPNDQAKPV